MGKKLQRKSVLPIGIGQREEIAPLGRPCIVDEDIEPAELPPRRLHELGRRALRAQVKRDLDCLAPLRADCGRDILERPFIARGKKNVATLARESQGNALSDPPARSCHQRDLPPKPVLPEHFLSSARLAYD